MNVPIKIDKKTCPGPQAVGVAQISNFQIDITHHQMSKRVENTTIRLIIAIIIGN